jgi:hypothetical protein
MLWKYIQTATICSAHLSVESFFVLHLADLVNLQGVLAFSIEQI